MVETVAKPSRSKLIASAIALGIAIIVLLSLGTWQVERLHWKENLIAEIEARRTAPPMTTAETAAKVAAGKDIDYAAITASGHFDHAHELYFLSTDDGQPGFFVYTPLILTDGHAVLVNRGFVPDGLRDPKKRPQGQSSGEVKISGLARARLATKPSFMVPDNDPAKNLYFWKDMDQMARAAGIASDKLLPFFIDADDQPNPGGYPKGGVTQIDLPNNHLSYAVTWYGLALALAVIAIMAYRKRRRAEA